MSNYSETQFEQIMGDANMEPTLLQTKQLVSPQQLAELMERRDLPAWIQTLSHLGAIIVIGYFLYTTWGSWYTVPLFMIQGVLLSYLYAAQHEFSHQTPFRTRWLNQFFGIICGFLGIFPYWMDRTHHMLHHQYTNVRGLDQELVEFRSEDKPFTLWSYLWFLSGIDFFYGQVSMLLSHLFGRLTYYEKAHISREDALRITVESWWYTLAYCLVIALSIHYQTWIAVQVWLAPMLAMKWTHQMHNIAEHYGLPKVKEVPSNTRTIYTTPINRWLVWNMTYHTGHHRFANVPFYNLKKLDRLIRREVKHATRGYLPLHKDILKAVFKGRRFGYEGLM